MIKSYLLSAIRNISRRKLFSLINILGLAIGIACFLLSYYHIQYEYSFDKHFSKSPYLYRVITGNMETGKGWVRVSAPMPVKLKTDIPEIQEFARLINLNKASKTSVVYDNKTFYESEFFMADPMAVDFFDLKFIQGDHRALNDLKSVVLSKSKADQIFGFQNPIGKVLRINDEFEFTVGGVYEDFPDNTHLNMNFMVSFLNLETLLPGTSLDGNWGQFNYFAYVLLHPDAAENEVEKKIQAMEFKLSETNTFSLEKINLQPIADIHFQFNRGNLKPTYDTRNVFIYGISALAILLISLINFINLSTAGSTRRLREVGLRKTIGANRMQLILQFIGEAFVIAVFAAVLGIVAVDIFLLDLINRLFETHIVLDFANPVQWLILLGIILTISIISGWYIAYYILKVQPVNALKGGVKVASGTNPVRNLLLGVQFIIALTLLASVLFIHSQIDFLQQKDIGLQKEGIIHIPLYETQWKDKIEILKKELKNLKEVITATGTGFQPGTANWHQTVWWENQQEDVSMNIISGDADLFQTLGMEFVAGDREHITNNLRQELTYVVNESAAKLIGDAEILGKPVSPFGLDHRKPISGVVKDFNYKSLHHGVEPCVLVLGSRFKPDNLLVKLETSNINLALSNIKSKLSEIAPNVAFEYHFLDDRFEALYAQEKRSQNIVSLYTYIAIFLSMLGLFGIVSFEVNERTKEMAIRKILGITNWDMGVLISGKFLKIFGFASLVAIPLTWYIMNGWLENFTYRITLSSVWFLVAIGIILSLIVVTIIVKLFQLNRANVAEVLKYE